MVRSESDCLFCQMSGRTESLRSSILAQAASRQAFGQDDEFLEDSPSYPARCAADSSRRRSPLKESQAPDDVEPARFRQLVPVRPDAAAAARPACEGEESQERIFPESEDEGPPARPEEKSKPKVLPKRKSALKKPSVKDAPEPEEGETAKESQEPLVLKRPASCLPVEPPVLKRPAGANQAPAPSAKKWFPNAEYSYKDESGDWEATKLTSRSR